MDNRVFPKDADYFQELQTKTGWSRTLYGFAKWCGPGPGMHTLDVGCGPGLLPAILSRFGCSAVGVDIDLEMFHPSPLHPFIAAADVISLPFSSHSFDIVTATNLLFLLSQPVLALIEMKRVLQPGGRVALLNPSEKLNVRAADIFAEDLGLNGMARDTMLNWAKRAEENHRWTKNETQELYKRAGMKCIASNLKIGPGFGRFSWGLA